MSTLSVSMRPQSLDAVIGNDSVKASIRKQVASGRIPTAIMLSGPPGVGKTTLAHIIARLIQGDIPVDEPIDLIEVNAADMNGVDAARELVEGIAYRPLTGLRKVVILDESQQLTVPAQNVFLKPMEAAESSTTFILATTDPSKIIPAIKSRCLHFELTGMAEVQIIELIERASEQMGVPYNDGFVVTAVNRTKDRWSPRELLMAYEKFVAGTPLTHCFSGTSTHEPLYEDVAKAVVRGDWEATRAMLEQIRTADYKGLQSVLSAFLGYALVKLPIGAKADAISGCLISLGNAGFADGVAYQALKGALYRCSKAINQSK